MKKVTIEQYERLYFLMTRWKIKVYCFCSRSISRCMYFPIRDHRPIVSIPMDIYIGRGG